MNKYLGQDVKIFLIVKEKVINKSIYFRKIGEFKFIFI